MALVRWNVVKFGVVTGGVVNCGVVKCERCGEQWRDIFDKKV